MSAPREGTPRRAVALHYEANAAAPRVVAKGQGFVAQTLLDRAAEAGIPVREAPELIELLMQLDLNELIPPALYAAVAEVLAWAYRLDRDAPPARYAGLPRS